MKKLLILFLGVVSSGYVFGAGEEKIGKICKIQMQSNGKAFIHPCDGWQAKSEECRDSWIVWDANNEPGKMMYSTALAAYAAGKPVTIRLYGCDFYDVTSMIRID